MPEIRLSEEAPAVVNRRRRGQAMIIVGVVLVLVTLALGILRPWQQAGGTSSTKAPGVDPAATGTALATGSQAEGAQDTIPPSEATALPPEATAPQVVTPETAASQEVAAEASSGAAEVPGRPGTEPTGTAHSGTTSKASSSSATASASKPPATTKSVPASTGSQKSTTSASSAGTASKSSTTDSTGSSKDTPSSTSASGDKSSASASSATASSAPTEVPTDTPQGTADEEEDQGPRIIGTSTTRPRTGNVSLSGAGVEVWLVGPRGQATGGTLPIGTYTIRARFGDKDVTAGSFTLGNGERLQVSCSEATLRCKASPAP